MGNASIIPPWYILYKSTEQYLETNLAQDIFDEYFTW